MKPVVVLQFLMFLFYVYLTCHINKILYILKIAFSCFETFLMFLLNCVFMVCYKRDRKKMFKIFNICYNGLCMLVSKVWYFFFFVIKKEADAMKYHHIVTYSEYPISPLSNHRLTTMLKRKMFVLDLDETLIHSDNDIHRHHSYALHADFVLKVTIDKRPVQFFVYKRPFVDLFLKQVSQWYELVIFTASMEVYGSSVADVLDNKRGILKRRFFRQHCTPEFGSYSKDLSAVTRDLSNVFILDNSPNAYKDYPDNAIPIKSWYYDQSDTALLDLLPMLDALRFTYDVRSILSRNMHVQWRYNTPLSSIVNSLK